MLDATIHIQMTNLYLSKLPIKNSMYQIYYSSHSPLWIEEEHLTLIAIGNKSISLDPISPFYLKINKLFLS